MNNTEYICVAEEGLLRQILDDLYRRKVQSVIVEGGRQLLQSFIDESLWDEARVFKSKRTFGKGIKAPVLPGKEEERGSILGDQLFIYKN